MKTTKFFSPYITGLFFGYLLSTLTAENKMNNYANFWPQFWFIFKICVILIGIAIFIDLFLIGFKKVNKNIAAIFLRFKNSFQKERMVDFFPVVYWDEKRSSVLAIIRFPKKVFLYSKTSAFIRYIKRNSVQEKEYENKNELYLDLLHQSIQNPQIKERVMWEDNSFSKKIRKGTEKILNIFTIDSDENIFYISRKGGKPKRFWNNEKIPNLYKLSFGFGKYNFELIIFGVDFFGRNRKQRISFVIEYNENGVLIRNN